MNADQIQNELIVIAHHVEDAENGLEEGDADYVQNSLDDIKEAIERLKQLIPPAKRTDIDRIADLMPD